MSTYSQLLRHPRWQRRRLEILNRAGWKCEECGTEEDELHVHHKRYRRGAKPWEYDDDDLVSLCDRCHDKAHHREPRQQSRGNLVRQAVTLLVHYPASAHGVSAQQIDEIAAIDRPGILLLTELLAQLREDPAANTAIVLERWRDRPEHASLATLAVATCLAPDVANAAAELRSSLNRLIAIEAPTKRLDELMETARDRGLEDAEKQELQGLLIVRGGSARLDRWR